MTPRGLRVVSGGRWTVDGRWVVVGPWFGHDNVIVYDPGNEDAHLDIWDCNVWKRETTQIRGLLDGVDEEADDDE